MICLGMIVVYALTVKTLKYCVRGGGAKWTRRVSLYASTTDPIFTECD